MSKSSSRRFNSRKKKRASKHRRNMPKYYSKKKQHGGSSNKDVIITWTNSGTPTEVPCIFKQYPSNKLDIAKMFIDEQQVLLIQLLTKAYDPDKTSMSPDDLRSAITSNFYKSSFLPTEQHTTSLSRFLQIIFKKTIPSPYAVVILQDAITNLDEYISKLKGSDEFDTYIYSLNYTFKTEAQIKKARANPCT